MRYSFQLIGVLLALVVSTTAIQCIHPPVGDPATSFIRLADAPVLSTDASCVHAGDKLYIISGYGPLLNSTKSSSIFFLEILPMTLSANSINLRRP